MKKKAVQYLLLISISLLIISVAVDIVFKKQEMHFEKDFSAAEIEKTYLNTLDECGFDSKWIKIKPNRDGANDSVPHIINVKLPSDLPFPMLVKYFQSKIDAPFVKLRCDELKRDKDFSIKVFSNGILKFESDIERETELVRKGVKVSFIITGFNDLSVAQQTDLLKTPYPFAVELVPTDKDAALTDSVKKFKKDYIVTFNDDISGKKFLLKDSYSRDKLIANVLEILSAFKYNSLYLIDTASDLHSQSNYPLIEKEMKRNKIRFENRNTYICLDDDKKENIYNGFIQAVEGSGGDSRIFLIDASNYISILDKVEKFFRKGNKIISVYENL